MPGIEITQWLGLVFLGTLLGGVAIRVLTGGLRTTGLIEGTTATGSRFVSGARVQLLIMTLLASSHYLNQAWQNPQMLPAVPQSWLLFLGGSHALYHATKFNGKRNKRFDI